MPPGSTTLYVWGCQKSVRGTVGPGAQITINNEPPIVNVVADISDTSITFNYPDSAQFNTATFNGYILTEQSSDAPPFTVASVDPSTTLAGFDQSCVTFDSTHVYMNVSGLSVQGGQSFTVDFTAVPEPANLSLITAGAFGVLARRRRR
jgi:PEP-CTERM motif